MMRTLRIFGGTFILAWMALFITLLLLPGLWEVVRTQFPLVVLAMTALVVVHTGFWLSRDALPKRRRRRAVGRRKKGTWEPSPIILTSRTSARVRTYRSDIPHPVFESEPARESARKLRIKLPIYTPYEYTDAVLLRDGKYYSDFTERL